MNYDQNDAQTSLGEDNWTTQQTEDSADDDNNTYQTESAHSDRTYVNRNKNEKTSQQNFNLQQQKLADFDKADNDHINKPRQLIPLQDQKYLAIWKVYLSRQFEKPINNCVIKTIENPRQNQIEIWIIGVPQDTQKIKDKLEAELQKYDQTSLPFTIQDQRILKNLYKQDLNKIFGNEIRTLIKLLPNIRGLEIEPIKKSLKGLSFLLIYEKRNDHQHLKLFCFKIKTKKQEKDFEMFLRYIGMNHIDFQSKYSVVITTKSTNKTYLTSIDKWLKEIKKLYKQYNTSLEEQGKITMIDVKSNLVFNRWKKYIVDRKYIIPKTVTQIYSKECIQLDGPVGLVDKAAEEINTLLKSWDKQIIKKTLSLPEKEVQFFKKKLQDDKKSLEDQYQCLITTNKERFTQDFMPAVTLSYNNKSMDIVFADISNFKCDAIVNSCNEWMSFGDLTMLTGVAQKIFEMGGLPYQQFCNAYISENGKMQPGQAIIYKLPINQYLKYIINVSTPIYSSGAQTHIDMETIIQTLKSILILAQDNQIKSLAIPIIGGGSAGYNFSHVATVIMNTLIDLHFSSKCLLSEISIVELNETKIKIAEQILQKVLKPPQINQQDQYIWHWKDTNGFKPYDDIEINQQINEAYWAFQQNEQLNEIRLVFPFSKKPGTHKVNLTDYTITDIVFPSKISKLSIKSLNGENIFYLDETPLDAGLSEYIMIQEKNKLNQFQIFIKRHKIVFSKDKVVQINIDTGYKRDVMKQIDNNVMNQQTPTQNILVNQHYQLVTNENHKTPKTTQCNEEQLIIQMFEGNNSNVISKTINDYIKNKQTTIKIILPNLREDDLIQLEEYLTKKSIAIIGQFTPGCSIDLVVFKSKEKKILDYTNKLIKNKQQYPVQWAPQTSNSEKFELEPTSLEYQTIQDQFQLTNPTGQVFKISRIQNKLLYQNYQQEREKLLKNGQTYTTIEQERMLWHGVKTNHPRIIYEGLKEAFDVTYSASGMWGPGIYFAERAEYSKGYSYTLTAQDDALMVGKKVFLCCQVTTGRVNVCASNSYIRRPPTGFDSVGGFTNGSNVFILYSMDVRRAYPAYEVIYQ